MVGKKIYKLLKVRNFWQVFSVAKFSCDIVCLHDSKIQSHWFLSLFSPFFCLLFGQLAANIAQIPICFTLKLKILFSLLIDIGIFFYLMKDQEKIKRKKLLTSRTEDAVRVESSSIAQPQYARERPATDSGTHGLTASSKPVPNTTTAAVRMPSPSVNGPSLDKVKQEKVKISSGNSLDDPRGVDGALPKKKAKKPELESGEAHFRPEKLPSQQGEERQKSYKQATAPPSHKSNLHQSGAVTNFEQSS